MKKSQRGFTLIELLVVVAIIGILASVVLASLNSARVKGREAAIKSNLRNMMTQAELSYDSAGNYSGTPVAIASILSGVTNAGGTAAYYSYDNTRWAVSVRLNSDSTRNFSVDQSGVVTWDATDTGTGGVTWSAAVTACTNAGSRLPSLEQLRSLYDAHGQTPPAFTSTNYWTSTLNPSDGTLAYYVNMVAGGIDDDPIGTSKRVRCIR